MIEFARDRRLDTSVKIGMRLFSSEREVIGKEILETIPKDKPVIFTTTHFSDIDVLAVMDVVSDFRKYKVVQARDHEKFRTNAGPYVMTGIPGRNNFISISPLLRQEDYVPMVEILAKGEAIIIAAYFNPEEEFYNQHFNQKGVILPEKGGLGAILLAQKTEALIIPTATVMDKRRKVRVIFGEPLTFEKINGLSEFRKDIETTKKVLEQLKNQSDKLMLATAKLVPEDKQGTWKNKV